MPTPPGCPMTLRNMRENGVCVVTAQCLVCNREADVDVEGLSETIEIPDVARRMIPF